MGELEDHADFEKKHVNRAPPCALAPSAAEGPYEFSPDRWTALARPPFSEFLASCASGRVQKRLLKGQGPPKERVAPDCSAGAHSSAMTTAFKKKQNSRASWWAANERGLLNS